MQKWEYTFPPTSKEDWIRQIEQDLKGKSIESLCSEWWPGEPLVPFHHAGDSVIEPIILPQQWFVGPPQIIEPIEFKKSSAEQINQILLEALQYGTQSFLMTNDGQPDLHAEAILEGIFPDMIKWHFYAHTNANPLFQSFLKRAPQNSFLRFQRLDDSTDLKSTLTDEYKIHPADIFNIEFEYDFSSIGNWIESTIQVFQRLLEDRSAWESIDTASSFFKKCILKLDADVHYFKHVIQSRVLQLLWLNLTREHSSQLECHIKPKVAEKPEHYLIRSSLSALAATLTGTASLCIHHLQDAGVPYFYKRIDRNVHHLLHLESGLPGGMDPLGGAYTLDYYTRNWTERIWNQLQAK
jgi:methylmalonyl-CoA mutase